MVKDSKMLRQHYFKSDSWRYDLISLLPTDIAYYWWQPGSCDSVSIKPSLSSNCIINSTTRNIRTGRYLTLLVQKCQYWSCFRNVCLALLLCDSIGYFACLECGCGSTAPRPPRATPTLLGYARYVTQNKM